MSLPPDIVDIRVVQPGRATETFECDQVALFKESALFAEIFRDDTLPPYTLYVITGQDVDIFSYFHKYVHRQQGPFPWLNEEASKVNWNYFASLFALCEALKAKSYHDALVHSLYEMTTSRDVPFSSPSPAEVEFIYKAIPKGRPFRRLLADLCLLSPGTRLGSDYPDEFADDVMEQIRESAENCDYVERCRSMREVDEYLLLLDEQ